jgi:hypothetical protein
MIGFALVALLATQSAKSIDLPVTQSFWNYVHASDPVGDEFLRVWGADGLAAPADGGTDSFSFAFLRIDVSSLPIGNPTKAVLILRNMSPAGYSRAEAKATPLEARELVRKVKGIEWDSSDAPAAAATIFGVSTFDDKANPPEVDIDLLAGPNDFKKALSTAETGPDKTLFLALTSAIDPAGGGRSSIYKFYSAAADNKAFRPYIKLEY